MPKTRKPDVTEPAPRVLHTVREWEVTLPQRGTQDWTELVQILMHRPDISNDWWPEQMIVSGLVSEAELTGNHEFGYETFVDGKLVKKVLAKAMYVAAQSETVFDPAHFVWALEATDRELEYNPELAAAKALERIQDTSDPAEHRKQLTTIIGLLTDHLTDSATP